MDTNEKSVSETTMSRYQKQLLGLNFMIPESHTPDQFMKEACDYFYALHGFNSEVLLKLQSKCPKKSIEHQCISALYSINLSNETIQELEFFESLASDQNTIEDHNFESGDDCIEIELRGFQEIYVTVAGSKPSDIRVYLNILKLSYGQLYNLPLEYFRELNIEIEELELSFEREGLAIGLLIGAKLEMIKQGIN